MEAVAGIIGRITVAIPPAVRHEIANLLTEVRVGPIRKNLGVMTIRVQELSEPLDEVCRRKATRL